MARMPRMARTPRMARWLADYPDPYKARVQNSSRTKFHFKAGIVWSNHSSFTITLSGPW